MVPKVPETDVLYITRLSSRSAVVALADRNEVLTTGSNLLDRVMWGDVGSP